MQLPISLDDDAFPDDATSDNATAFAFRQPLLALLRRDRAALLDLLRAYQPAQPARAACPKAFPELLRLVQEAIGCERRAGTPLDEALLEALDAALAGSVVCYATNSFLHGTAKKVYSALVGSQDPSVVRCADRGADSREGIMDKSRIFEAVEPSSVGCGARRGA